MGDWEYQLEEVKETPDDNQDGTALRIAILLEARISKNGVDQRLVQTFENLPEKS